MIAESTFVCNVKMHALVGITRSQEMKCHKVVYLQIAKRHEPLQ